MLNKSLYSRLTLKILLSLLFILCFSQLFGVEFKIDFYDKKIYYTDSTIRMKGIIRNNENSAYFFRATDKRIFNLKIKVFMVSGKKELPPSSNYIKDWNANSPYFYRDISLEPEEEYSFTFSLNNFVGITEPGIYLIQAEYLPDLTRRASLQSNRIYLNVRPKSKAPDYRNRLIEEKQAILERDDLAPDRVVDYVLKALQRGHWDKFFLYLDLASLLQNNAYLKRRYVTSSEEERDKIVTDYKRSLQINDLPEDANLVRIPQKYEISRTIYDSSTAQVRVAEFFNEKGRPDSEAVKTRYTYYLKRKDGVWFISRYETEFIE